MHNFIYSILRHSIFDSIRPFLKLISGWKPDSTLGSNWRRIFSRFVLILCVALIIEATFSISRSFAGGFLFASGLIVIGLYYFLDVVIAIPFRASASFPVNIFRLFLDNLLSGCFLILAFSSVYRTSGIDPDTSALNHIYFSAVTFSTLGFGDYSPLGYGKAFAAIEAMIGNLHLGIMVATLFQGLQNQSSDNHSGNDQNDSK